MGSGGSCGEGRGRGGLVQSFERSQEAVTKIEQVQTMEERGPNFCHFVRT